MIPLSHTTNTTSTHVLLPIHITRTTPAPALVQEAAAGTAAATSDGKGGHEAATTTNDKGAPATVGVGAPQHAPEAAGTSAWGPTGPSETTTAASATDVVAALKKNEDKKDDKDEKKNSPPPSPDAAPVVVESGCSPLNLLEEVAAATYNVTVRVSHERTDYQGAMAAFVNVSAAIKLAAGHITRDEVEKQHLLPEVRLSMCVVEDPPALCFTLGHWVVCKFTPLHTVLTPYRARSGSGQIASSHTF